MSTTTPPLPVAQQRIIDALAQGARYRRTPPWKQVEGPDGAIVPAATIAALLRMGLVAFQATPVTRPTQRRHEQLHLISKASDPQESP